MKKVFLMLIASTSFAFCMDVTGVSTNSSSAVRSSIGEKPKPKITFKGSKKIDPTKDFVREPKFDDLQKPDNYYENAAKYDFSTQKMGFIEQIQNKISNWDGKPIAGSDFLHEIEGIRIFLDNYIKDFDAKLKETDTEQFFDVSHNVQLKCIKNDFDETMNNINSLVADLIISGEIKEIDGIDFFMNQNEKEIFQSDNVYIKSQLVPKIIEFLGLSKYIKASDDLDKKLELYFKKERRQYPMPKPKGKVKRMY